MSWIDVFLCDYVDAFNNYRLAIKDNRFEDAQWWETVRKNAAWNIEARIEEIIAEEIIKAKNE